MGVGKEVAVIVAKRRGKNWIVHTSVTDHASLSTLLCF
jgi:hypothetical protein